VVAPSAGAVVLLPFPFSDLSQSKLRPAVVIADADRDDWILCQITSKAYTDSTAIKIEEHAFEAGSLKLAHMNGSMNRFSTFSPNSNLMLFP
jgi:mRNA interferase MazF